VLFGSADDAGHAVSALLRAGLTATPQPHVDGVSSPLAQASDITGLVRALDEAGIAIADIVIAEPTLDDVYLSLHQAQWQPPRLVTEDVA
jgi:ABC-2 type transport system ATP-binding protein